MAAYFLLIVYLAVDYIQPGVKSAAVAALRPALVVGALLLLATLLHFASPRARPIRFPLQSKLFLCLLVLIALSIPFAVVKQSTLTTLELMAKMFVVYFILTQVVNTARRLHGLLYAFVAINLWVAFEGIRAFYSPEGRAGAETLTGVLSKFLGNNNDFALALVVVFPFAYFLMVHTRSWLARAALAGCMSAYGAAIMASLSRGGQVGLLAVFAMIGLGRARRLPFLLTVAGLGLVVGLSAPAAYWDRVRSIASYEEDPQAQSRFYTWRAGLQMAIRSPLVGVGAGNFSNAYGRRFVDNRPEGTSATWLTAHSVYFQVLGELGLIGFALLLMLVVANLRACRRLRRAALTGDLNGPGGESVMAAASACSAGLVGFLTSGAFLSAAYYPHFWYLTALIVATESVARDTVTVHTTKVVTPARAVFRSRPALRAT